MKARFSARQSWLLAWLLAGLLCVVAPVVARAQSTAGDSARPDSPAVRGRWTFGGWVAGATGQPLETRLGHVHDRDLFITAVRAMHPLVVAPRFKLLSTVDLFPLVVATANRDYTVLDVFPGCEGPALCSGESTMTIPSRHTAYAAGIAPLGFEGVVSITKSLGLSLGGEGGALYFNRRIPDPGETRFNFMADANAAIRLSLGANRPTVVGGFQINHISNGGTGHVNPGMDSRMLFFGIER